MAGEIIELTLDASQEGVSLRDDPTSPDFSVFVGDRFSLDFGHRDLREEGGGLFTAYIDTIISDASAIRPVLYDSQVVSFKNLVVDDPGQIVIGAPGYAPVSFSLTRSANELKNLIEQDFGYGEGNVEVIFRTDFGFRADIEINFTGEQYEFVDVPDLTFDVSAVNVDDPATTLVDSLPPYLDGDKTRINPESFVRYATFHRPFYSIRSFRKGSFSTTAEESIDYFGGVGFNYIDPAAETNALFSAQFVAIAPATDVTFLLDDAYDNYRESFSAFGYEGPVPAELILIGDDAFLRGDFIVRPELHRSFTVNTTADTPDANLGDGVAEDSFGFTSLRAAIQEANASLNPEFGIDQIDFDLPIASPPVIEVSSALPAITESVVIDGTTQSGFDGSPVVQLVATSRIDAGLELASDRITVKGLSVSGFQSGIHISAGDRSEVSGNYLGLSPDAAAAPNRYGLRIDGGSKSTVSGNVISGNDRSGMIISGADTSENQILNNLIGLSPDGETDLGNAGAGVALYGSSDNTLSGNVISGNGGSGVILSGSQTNFNVLRDNLIGTSATGDTAIGNGGSGVAVYSGFNIIGDDDGGNVISGNDGSGILLQTEANDTQIAANKIGTDISGALAIGNGGHGINVYSVSNVIGGNAADASHGNVISGNALHGINLGSDSADFNRINRNLVGTDIAGDYAIANGGHGIQINGGDFNSIGVNAANVVSGNNRSGIAIKSNADNNLISSNGIGMSSDSTKPVANQGAGVIIASQSSGNSVQYNTIAGNQGPGVIVSGTDSSGNGISYNQIGVTREGLVVPNGAYAASIRSNNNYITQNTVGGSRIGFDVAGDNAFENTFAANSVGTDVYQTADFGMQIGARFRDGAGDNSIGGVIANNEIGVQITADAGLGNEIDANATFFNNSVASVQDLGPSAAFATQQASMDVSGDGLVTPADALQVLDMLANQNANGESAARQTLRADVNGDVNGDGTMTPADVLEVLNWLSDSYARRNPSPAPGSQSLTANQIDSAFADDAEDDFAVEAMLF
ncbi:NosD domain-containing protein [Stieleria marina]|uniref:NosD domain-containing protein n=1 Tax=Stieleria marina TaxID=1930275 RepID=UPI003AF347FD